MRKPFGPLSRLCHVPDDLESVTTRGEEVEPSRVGLSTDDVERLWHAVEAVYRTGLHPALQVSIRCEDQPVLDRAIGYARGNGPDDAPAAPKTPISLDTPFILYSASKAVTAFLVLKLDEVGALHIEDRVADYIPAFARHGKDGPEGFADLVRTLRRGFPDLRLEVEDIIAEGDRVVVRTWFTGTNDGPFAGPPTGRSIRMAQIHIFRVRDGKVAEHWACMVELGGMTQLGLMPAAAGARG